MLRKTASPLFQKSGFLIQNFFVLPLLNIFWKSICQKWCQVISCNAFSTRAISTYAISIIRTFNLIQFRAIAISTNLRKFVETYVNCWNKWNWKLIRCFRFVIFHFSMTKKILVNKTLVTCSKSLSRLPSVRIATSSLSNSESDHLCSDRENCRDLLDDH